MTSVFRHALIVLLMVFRAATAGAGEVTVFAAASLKTALDEIAAEWRETTGDTVRFAYAGSSALARQIQAGAPADIFISANTAWMDRLDRDGLIDGASRTDLLRNRLVLVAAGTDAAPVEITPALDLAGMLGGGRLAMALVQAVPAGIYGRAALGTLGLWEGVAARTAQVDNVRAALALVATGEAPLGIVYATDAAADDRVSVIGVFPAASHPPIVYPAATIAESGNPLKTRFLDFLRSGRSRAIFGRQGFGIVE